MKENPYLKSLVQRKFSWFVLFFIIIVAVLLSNKPKTVEKQKNDVAANKINEINDSYPIQRLVQQVYQLRNSSPRTIKNAVFYVYAPVKKTGFQKVDIIDISENYRLISDAEDNQLIEIKFQEFKGRQTSKIAIKTSLKLTDEPVLVKRHKSLSKPSDSIEYDQQNTQFEDKHERGFVTKSIHEKDATHIEKDDRKTILGKNLKPPIKDLNKPNPIPQKLDALKRNSTQSRIKFPHGNEAERVHRQFLQANQIIDFDKPEIQLLAAQLKSDNVDQTLLNIMTWINDNIKQIQKTQVLSSNRLEGFVPPPPPIINKKAEQPIGVHKTLKDSKGNVLDRLYLFTALCRANNIPVRPVIGYVYHDGMQTSAWLEFYDQNTWWIADLERKQLRTNQSQYVAMRIMRNLPTIQFKNLDQLLFEAVGIEVI